MGPTHPNHTAAPAMFPIRESYILQPNPSHKNPTKRAKAQRRRRNIRKAIALEVLAKTAYWAT